MTHASDIATLNRSKIQEASDKDLARGWLRQQGPQGYGTVHTLPQGIMGVEDPSWSREQKQVHNSRLNVFKRVMSGMHQEGELIVIGREMGPCGREVSKYALPDCGLMATELPRPPRRGKKKMTELEIALQEIGRFRHMTRKLLADGLISERDIQVAVSDWKPAPEDDETEIL